MSWQEQNLPAASVSDSILSEVLRFSLDDGVMLWRDLKVWQVFGANTNVGKTIVSTLLCRALQTPDQRVLYLKPVSTGPRNEEDVGHIDTFVPGIVSKNVSQFSRPLSPHLAAQLDKDPSIPRSDASILSRVKDILGKHIEAGGRYALVETAGGVLSPGPSGTVQADLYRPLRLPTILVGDSKLGGIATTISAFESLHVRGFDVDSVVLFDDPEWGNFGYLNEYFQNHGITTFALPKPPEKHQDGEEDKRALSSYYGGWSKTGVARNLLDLLNQKHFSRISKLTSMPSQAEAVIWHPFRQHGIPHNIIAIDSAYKDHFQTYNQESDPALKETKTTSTFGLTPLAAQPTPKSLLTPLFDASASWWTQGLGHGNPNVALTAAHAAGRYGHVMFAHAVHEPALDISYNLLTTLQNPRLSRVFFTDNGSTGMEVAVKMALRASSQRYGWAKDDEDGKHPVAILGLKGSYHGDTIGVMNCSEPSVFNEKVDWHQPWGHWFDPPSLLMRNGVWELTLPEEMNAATSIQKFDSLGALFDFDGRVEDAKRYESHITTTLDHLVRDQGKRFGALILEPIIMGAGGMIFVDPLFQRTLIKTIRANPSLIGAGSPTKQFSEPSTPDSEGAVEWSGLPVVADEVFTGLYRLGRASSSSFLSCPSDFGDAASPSTISNSTQPALPPSLAPDISVHAKLLTAGLLPLALTTASESIFRTFLSDSKSDALLHGHSYTAHPIGCMVGNKALDEYRRMDTSRDGSWSHFKSAWSGPSASTSSSASPASSASAAEIYSFFPPSLLQELSHHPRLTGCFALGTVLVLKMAAPHGSTGGYTSTASADLQSCLLTLLDDDGCGIHSRVLGDVIYFMTSLTTTPEQVGRLGRTLLKALNMES
ncbi:dethiobiotin synthase [Fonsecaea pedrosoi CBS 271.37]|uniref:Unplaced genomic scaffold supercont1.4, whole genome shotgun sequence n=1 Tax=Fonsecaea pedrosoi CBS 271.37 TaxID=1442368 RepID=A0A0D2DRK6_9EURO|nr:dethiobiotin synthase [Fonsecaea pedrosoi CBS 271.37]KIW80521.1 dethiobiotin synthase [Fonsecaea pedrosoi CBS 271.37]